MTEAATETGTTTIRVDRDTKRELVRAQQEIRAEFGWTVSYGEIIKALLAGRKPGPT